MVINSAIPSDIPLLAQFGSDLTQLHFEFDPEYYTFDQQGFPESFADWLKGQINLPTALILVAKEDGKVIGFLSGFVKYLFPWFNIKRVGHISFMFIDEEYRRKGVGKNLLAAAKEWFSDQGLKYVELYVNERNDRGISFWKSMGFEDFQKFLRMKL